jgi:membrane fusion protein, macrolide-specific efflux system
MDKRNRNSPASFHPPRIWLALILTIALALLLAACSPREPQELPTPTPLPTPLVPLKPTYTVQRGDVVSQITFTGRIRPVAEENLYFRKSGRLNKLYVKRGDVVTEGQLLAELDSSSSEFDVRRAQVNLEIQQLQLELARLQTPEDSELYPLTLAIKEREVELAQIALDELTTAIAEGQITSPIAGTVLSLSLVEGAQVEAFKPVIVVADLDQLELSGELKPDELASVSVGLPVTARPVGRAGEQAAGVVEKLPYQPGSESPGSAVIDVRITLSAPPADLGYSLGDLVNVTAILEAREGVLWLPPQAIRSFEGRRFVIVQEGSNQRRVDIRLGVESNDRVEILDGLEEGQEVVAP